MLRHLFCVFLFLAVTGLVTAPAATASTANLDSVLLYTWEDEATGTVYYVYGPSSIHTVEYVDGVLQLYGVQSGDQVEIESTAPANWAYFDNGSVTYTLGTSDFIIYGPGVYVSAVKSQSKVAQTFRVQTNP
jgi:hypothetical protein